MGLFFFLVLDKKFVPKEFVSARDHDSPVQKVIAEKTIGAVARSIYSVSASAIISAFWFTGMGVQLCFVGGLNKEAIFMSKPINGRTLKLTSYSSKFSVQSLTYMLCNEDFQKSPLSFPDQTSWAW